MVLTLLGLQLSLGCQIPVVMRQEAVGVILNVEHTTVPLALERIILP